MIRAIATEELLTVLPSQAARLEIFTRQSNPLLVWIEDAIVVALFGLIPLGGYAYIWTYTDEVQLYRHRISYARKAYRIIHTALQRYPILVGHCLPHQRRWLTSLGAIFAPGPEGHLTFQIGH